MNKFYITTPIYYVNDVPHIGHAYTTVAADVLARYWKQKIGKDNVFFLTGTDEHGVKVAQAAKESGKTPKEFADFVVPRFQEAWKLLGIEYDHFIRTTDPKHEAVAQEVLQKIYDNGHIYEGVYEGFYCEGCEKFLTEDDLVNGKCPLHPNKEPVHQKEKNYFFKLSAFREKLIKTFEDKDYKILPETRRNEVLGKLKDELKDVSMSRAGVSWGIPIPWNKEQTIYVWVDALFNYYSATRFLKDRRLFWPSDLHLIGKDILWFHTVIWAALLLAADLPLPRKVFAHGFFTINGQKMSKSLGNVISPGKLVEKFGADATRYLLLSEFPFGEDGDFSFDKLISRYNADLANGVGNLVSRVAKLAEKSGEEFEISIPSISDKKHQSHSSLIENLQFYEVINFANEKIARANKYIDESRPWDQKGIGQRTTLEHLVREIIECAYLLKPILPQTAQKIEKQFSGPKIASGEPLFPRIK